MRFKCLTKRERSLWLKHHGHVEDPFFSHEDDQPKFRLQFYTSEKFAVNRCFALQFIEFICGEGEILFYIEDTDFHRSDHVFVFSSLWKSFGEKRSFVRTPACSASVKGKEILSNLFALSVAFQWRTYLHGSYDQLSLFNWEGDICDIWTASKARYELAKKLVGRFEFKWVYDDGGKAPAPTLRRKFKA